MTRKLAVQSYCYRGFTTPGGLIDKVRETGLSLVELCGVHADFADRAGFPRRIAELARGGIEVMSIGVNQLNGDAAHDRPFFESARDAKLSVMSVDIDIESAPRSFMALDAMAELFDVRLAIHNHGGKHWLGNAAALRWVFGRTSRRIGLNLDTAWALHAHEDPIALARDFADRLFLVHVKDFTFDAHGEPSDVVVGTGSLDLGELDRVITGSPELRGVVLEYEGDVANPVPALRDCVARIRESMTHVS